MIITRKMIINRNDLEFLYAEQISDLMGNTNYIVYHGTKPSLYSEETFFSVYGEDKRYSLIHFVSTFEDRLMEMEINDKGLTYILNTFKGIKSKINGKDYANPSLIGCKCTFIYALQQFNSLIPNITNEDSVGIDLEKYYQRVIKQEKH